MRLNIMRGDGDLGRSTLEDSESEAVDKSKGCTRGGDLLRILISQGR